MKTPWQEGAQRRKRKLLKFYVMRHYSNGAMECARCGENDLDRLSIDHLQHGMGAIERAQVHPGRPYKYNASQRFYKWLRWKKYPPGYRVLCVKCNSLCNTENQLKLQSVSTGSGQATVP